MLWAALRTLDAIDTLTALPGRSPPLSALRLSDIIRMEGGAEKDRDTTISEIATTLSPVFQRYGVRKAVLFGSCSQGTATAKSDIDLLVDSGLHGLRFVGLTEDIRRAVVRDVDPLDVAHIERHSRIDREIADTGATLYEE